MTSTQLTSRRRIAAVQLGRAPAPQLVAHADILARAARSARGGDRGPGEPAAGRLAECAAGDRVPALAPRARRRRDDDRLRRPPPAPRTRVRVLFFPRPRRLDVWCRSAGVEEAVVAGFFVRDPYRPLGEVWVDGRAVRHEPVAAPYAPRRACVVSDGDGVRIVPRATRCRGDRRATSAGRPAARRRRRARLRSAADHEGFSAGAEQFDSDITDERHPRAALGVADDALVAVACDGRRTGRRRRAVDARARRRDGRARRQRRDQPRRRRVDDARPPRAPAQPALLQPGPAGAAVAARSSPRWPSSAAERPRERPRARRGC